MSSFVPTSLTECFTGLPNLLGPWFFVALLLRLIVVPVCSSIIDSSEKPGEELLPPVTCSSSIVGFALSVSSAVFVSISSGLDPQVFPLFWRHILFLERVQNYAWRCIPIDPFNGRFRTDAFSTSVAARLVLRFRWFRRFRRWLFLSCCCSFFLFLYLFLSIDLIATCSWVFGLALLTARFNLPPGAVFFEATTVSLIWKRSFVCSSGKIQFSSSDSVSSSDSTSFFWRLLFGSSNSFSPFLSGYSPH